MAIGNCLFNVKNKGTSLNNLKYKELGNLNIILSAVEDEIIKIDKRTLKVPSSIDLKTVLTEIVNSFKVPNLQKSEIKLKFTLLTKSNFKTENNFLKTGNLNNFVSHLSPVLSFKTSFQIKFFDGKFSKLTTEMFIGSNPIAKFDSRDERGRKDLFNLVFLLTDTYSDTNGDTNGDTNSDINSDSYTNSYTDTHTHTDKDTDSINYKTLYIPNWGIIVTGSKYNEEHVEKVFISGLKRFLGFPKNKNLPEMFEIDIWNEKVKEFYFKKYSEMSKSLYGSKWVKANSAKEAFDIIEQVYNDPKLLAAAYFPDDHKFAVYLPVYLPLILPILIGLISFIKKKKRGKVYGGGEKGEEEELKVKKE